MTKDTAPVPPPPVVGNVTFQAGDPQASKQLRHELDSIHTRQALHEGRLDGHKGKIDELEHVLGDPVFTEKSVDERLCDIEAKLPGYAVGTRLDAMAQGQEQQVFDSVEALSSVRQRLDALDDDRAQVNFALAGCENRLDSLESVKDRTTQRVDSLVSQVGFSSEYIPELALAIRVAALETRTAKLPVMTAENGDKVPVSMTPSSVTAQAFERLDALEARVTGLSEITQRDSADARERLDALEARAEGLSMSAKLTRTHLEDLDNRVRKARDRVQPSRLPTVYTGKLIPPANQVAHGDIWLHPEHGRLKDEFGVWVPAPAPQARQVDLDEIESLRLQLKDEHSTAADERASLQADNARLRVKADAAVKAEQAVREQLDEARREQVDTKSALDAALRKYSHAKDDRNVVEGQRNAALSGDESLRLTLDAVRDDLRAANQQVERLTNEKRVLGEELQVEKNRTYNADEQLGDWHPADWGCPEPEEEDAQTARDTGDI